MSKTIRLDAHRGGEDDQEVAKALNESLGEEATVTLRRPPPGSLSSVDPSTQSFLIEVLNSNALEAILEIIFVYFIARKATRVKVGDVEVDLKQDPKRLASNTAKKLKDK
jgi:hypothetical protein